MNGRSQADVFGKLSFIPEPFWVEDFCCELSGDSRADAWMSGEKFDCRTDWFFTECLFDFLFGGFELCGNEEKFFDEGVEAISQWF